MPQVAKQLNEEIGSNRHHPRHTTWTRCKTALYLVLSPHCWTAQAKAKLIEQTHAKVPVGMIRVVLNIFSPLAPPPAPPFAAPTSFDPGAGENTTWEGGEQVEREKERVT